MHIIRNIRVRDIEIRLYIISFIVVVVLDSAEVVSTYFIGGAQKVNVTDFMDKDDTSSTIYGIVTGVQPFYVFSTDHYGKLKE